MKNKRRIIPIFRINFIGDANYEDIQHHPQIKEVVINETVYAVKDGLMKNKKSVNLFELYNSDMFIELERSEWKKSLNNALEFFIEKEDYTQCAEIRDLLKKI